MHSSGLSFSVLAVTAATAVISDKHILVSNNYHFPFRLLLEQLFAALLIVIVWNFLRHYESSDSTTRPWRSIIDLAKNLRTNLPLLLSAACLALSLPLWMQAFLHFENITALIMLLPLVNCVGSARLLWRHEEPRPAWHKSRMCSVVVGSALILLDHYRLTPNGLAFGMTAVLLVGAAKLLYDEQDQGSAFAIEGPTFVVLTITCSIFITAILFVHTEMGKGSGMLFHEISLFHVNLLASALTLALGISTFGKPYRPADISLFMYALVGLSAFLSRWWLVSTYLSIVQIAAFAITVPLACLHTTQDLPQWTQCSSVDLGEDLSTSEILVDHASQGDNEAFNKSNLSGLIAESRLEEYVQESETQSKMSAWGSLSNLMLLVLAVTTWILFLIANFTSMSTQDTSSALSRLCPLQQSEPAAELDIVISMFQEPLNIVKETTDRLQKIPSIAEKNRRLMIYTKDQAADLESIKERLNATQVILLPNVGREGHTYLHHIISQWDNLATQTMFLQAEIHNPREFFPRIRDYYGPDTGMLSLGFSGQTCECDDCGDRFDWWDDSGIVSRVYQEAYQQSCEDRPILLSYKGQFVVSARRLRANNMTLYEDLRDALTDPSSWSHQEQYLQGRPDSLSAPFFGYTLERLWSVILQCSSMHIATYCPTLLSGTRRGGSRADCQCFDTLESEKNE